jgi:PPM family protein phosphatase
MNFLKRLFGKSKPPSPDGIKTAPLDPHVVERRETVFPGHVEIGSAQSTGIERNHNEDALFVMLGNSAGQETLADFGIFVVADGMGGHRSGEIASAISVRTVAKRMTASTIVNLLDPEPSEEEAGSLQDSLRHALEEANQMVVDRVPGGGTTLTVAILLGKQLTIGHVGDTRAYFIANGEAKVITRDHSLVERLRELGQLSEEEVATHPQRNVLYRAIGQGANLEVDISTVPIPFGGYLLLCSDGLWGVVPDRDILRIITTTPLPQEACEQLVNAANAAGGPDNITAILVHFPPG